MIQIEKMTFNPFQENTYVLYDETKECIIIDPGCYEKNEQNKLVDFIAKNDLKPVKIVNTHGHIDHVLGNYFVHKTYGIDVVGHENLKQQLAAVPTYSSMYGFNAYQPSPDPVTLLKEGDVLKFGNSALDVYFCPGHAPDHLVFHHTGQGFVINGDVLFKGSFGRIDLPGGDFETLKNSILNTMFKLPDDTVVYTGHGEETTIGVEKISNPIHHASF
ncbi:MBL fold metallo-hydrolase [Putridiphycobacter roseus]|uniref:MBL fold metallo-hydrolase n=1 Tax=Putridiphycobacter roseus TaxID=2219161 RepID=A0A2W1NRP3_9FLAO|nr:MBL fold metallo-hydrolase [Putridiphycobacter roseus]PZE17338.1 MBL fold metallo-hydrolase [Putridiphycobacter roseus]